MKKKLRVYKLLHNLIFRSTSETGLSLDDVYQRVVSFMQKDPRANYNFMIGTDCQVHSNHTVFITGIIIHRIGRGAWACYTQTVVPREIESIREKLSMETSYSQEVATYFSGDTRVSLENIVLPYLYQGASLEFIIDIDAGKDERKSKTAPFVKEMVSRVESMGMKARVKPDSVASSSYADTHSKRPHSGFVVEQ